MARIEFTYPQTNQKIKNILDEIEDASIDLISEYERKLNHTNK